MFDFLDNQYIRDLKTFHASHDLTRSSRRLFVAKNGRLFACQEHLTLETAQPDKGFSQEKRVVLNRQCRFNILSLLVSFFDLANFLPEILAVDFYKT